MKKVTTNRLANGLQLIAVILLFGYAAFPANETAKENLHNTSNAVVDSTGRHQQLQNKIDGNYFMPIYYSITAP